MLGMEVRNGQVELAIAGELYGVLQHVGSVARSQARINDQRGLTADDNADIRHEIHAPVWNDKDPVGELNGVTLHNWRWTEVRGTCVKLGGAHAPTVTRRAVARIGRSPHGRPLFSD